MKTKNKLNKKEVKKLAYTMVSQTIRCFDSFAFDDYDSGLPLISQEEIENVLTEIEKIAEKYDNEYSHIENVGMIIEAIVGAKK